MTDRNHASTNPADQVDETEGQVRKSQVTEHNLRHKDLPRGSEPATRAASRNRR